MKIEHTVTLHLTRNERRTIETALWVMLRESKDPGEKKRAIDLYDRLVNDATGRRTRGTPGSGT